MKKVFVATCLVLCFFSAQAGGYAIRIIKSGESIGLLANLYDISIGSIMRLNNLESELMYPGDKLKIPLLDATGGVSELAPSPPPGFVTHTIQAGEALSTVAKHYDISLEAIVGANPDISSLDMLPVGLELLIPPAAGLVTTIAGGTDLISLIQENHLNIRRVLDTNNIHSPNDIRTGMMVFLPEVEPTDALERLAKVREEENRYVWPVQGRITSYFGRRNLGMGTSSFHSAIDVAAPTGTPVQASRSGTVVYSGWSTRGYGNLIKVQHPGGSETWYAHNSKILVSVGDYVNQGDVIGRVGSTGLSTGPHLHFEIHEAGKAIDPLVYLR
ncbi:MAG: peptidoglycan DD-metalloendopeptidase family protein [Trueperaceae bacterium]|nr:peptidoglycan DD-metalloendopeptidase family protein [Trueperaceae bacterium]